MSKGRYPYEAFAMQARGALERSFEREPLGADSSYAEDYPALIEHFANAGKEGWTASTARVAALAVYGWMPTTLKSGVTDFDRVTELLNAKCFDQIPLNFLNNSFVGTSKFLHFCDPHRYAIWDSRVCEALGWGGYVNAANREAKAFAYQQHIRRFSEVSGHSLRTIEFALFWAGKG